MCSVCGVVYTYIYISIRVCLMCICGGVCVDTCIWLHVCVCVGAYSLTNTCHFSSLAVVDPITSVQQ